MISIKRNSERGRSQYGWLDSWHTFSFGDYYDPENKGVSVLRVINDDTVQANAGFESHGHRDMEIISYILDGAIEHKDSMGHTTRLEAGDVQVMTAGTGVVHSEYNASASEPLRFLQIWIRPDQKGLAPGYRQFRFPHVRGRQTIVSPDGTNGSLRIHQDATIERVRVAAGDEIEVEVAGNRTAYLHIVHGDIKLANISLLAGDGAEISAARTGLSGAGESEALLFSLP